jgi:hypothetical protein
MPGDPKPPTEARLSEADVKKVLERAVRIDASHSAVSVSDLTDAAREAGISEQAVFQAVRELFEEPAMSPVDHAGSVPGRVRSRIASGVRMATFSVLFLVALLAIFAVLRIVMPS